MKLRGRHAGWLDAHRRYRPERQRRIFLCDWQKKAHVHQQRRKYLPAEIESQLFEFPAVADVCVIGVPDSQKGEVGKALIVLKPGMTATVQEIRDFLKPRLATIRIPVYIQFVDFLPKNAAGKTSLPIIASLYGHNE